ncbi:hypothetical protein DFR52_105334 [Hoeflea marina]|uniref:Divergent polysaccharide deacetylase n=1 Tax=Hoeflea marina TaxID=274592 RepID=A0A317PHH6_9HYPH|nr:divergent polysaccharide deacetylase family protein [Hoeflea marina]PWV98351.1 hypothetical protein DFR52_105334 [Hoeflea marina]
MGTDINKPLGGRRPADKRTSAADRKLRHRLTGTAIVLALAGGAGWAAWTAMPPEPSIVTESADTVAVDAPGAAEPMPEVPAPSASVETQAAGDSGQLPILSGQSGARIDTTLSGDGQTITRVSPVPRSGSGPVLLQAGGGVGQNPRMAHLPDPDVIEHTPAGDLPIRGADGKRPADVYARPWSGARGARVAIVVGGLGLSQTGSQFAIRTLPEEITLAFAANGNSLQRWMQEARRDGHELLLQVPFEPFDYPANDPGPGTLTVAAGAEKNLADLHAAMARFTNYTGITNFMGGRFLSSPDAMEPVMRDIGERGLLFFDDGTSAQSLTDKFARAMAIPFAASNLVLDGRQERGYILEKLDELERIARRNGTAIGVASAFEVSVSAIADWANEAKARGIEIVSISAVADDPTKQ